MKIANQLHDVVKKYERKLHEQTLKFRCELEADTPGLPEKIEAGTLLIFLNLNLLNFFN